jgi:2-keto-3-deoxy-L-rhamnonate aldolase RhmA
MVHEHNLNVGGDNMKRKPNQLIEKFRQGRHPYGMQMYLYSPEVVELAGLAGFDFIMLDMEHSRTNYETMVHLIQVCELHDVTPYVRVPANEPKYIRFALESGARGIVVPHVMSAEDVKKAKRALFFGPDGRAGVCPAIRASGFLQQNWEDYMRDTNANTSLFVLFEDVEAIEKADEILAELKPGRDGFGLGLADIIHSLRTNVDEPVNWQHPYTKTAAEVVVPKAKALGLCSMGMAWPNPDKAGIENAIKNGTDAIIFHPEQDLILRKFKEIAGICEEML